LEQEYDKSKVEFIFGVGISKQISLKGYGSITDNELYESVVQDKGWVAEQVVLETLPLLLRGNMYLPVFKYVAESGVSQENLVENIQKKLQLKYDSFLTRSNRSNVQMIRGKYSDIDDLIIAVTPQKAVEIIPLLGKSKTNKERLKEFIIQNLEMLHSEKGTIKSNFRKLIRYYDWRVYREKISF
jgi:hypothetical protein